MAFDVPDNNQVMSTIGGRHINSHPLRASGLAPIASLCQQLRSLTIRTTIPRSRALRRTPLHSLYPRFYYCQST